MRILAVAIACGSIILGFGCRFLPGSQVGEKVNEAWETHNKTFKISVTAYAEENGGFVAGAYYVFRSAKVNSDVWTDIMRFRHDDPVAIPRDQIHFVNDEVAYVFMGWMYAVTTDSGSTWSVWDARKDLPGWQCCNYILIKSVLLEQDGAGTMQLKPIDGRRGEVPELHTRDFGRHWSSDLQPNR